MDSEILDRLPPQDLAAEQQVIGSLLLDARRCDDVGGMLRPDDFYAAAHRTLYGRILGLWDRQRAVDVPMLMSMLRKYGELETVGGTAYLAEVAQSVAVAGHAVHHAGVVRRLSRKRQIIHAATDMLRAAYEPGSEPDELLSRADAALQAVQSGNYDSEPATMFEAVQEAMHEIDEIAARKSQAGVMVGLPRLDERLGGVFRGELTVLAARPGQGKTSLALQIAAHSAERGRRVFFASLEMSRTELATKRLCALAGVSQHKVRTGTLDRDDQRKLSEAATSAAVKNFIIQDCPTIRPFDIQRGARRAKAELVLVDYLQYVTPPDATKKRYEQVGDISRQLKTMARQLDVPVIACAQIGRQAELGKEARPKLSHLRESGNIEQDADAVWLLWRPDKGIAAKSKDQDGDRWDAEIDISKNRKGPNGIFRLDWCGELTTFTCHATPGYSEFEDFSGSDSGADEWDTA